MAKRRSTKQESPPKSGGLFCVVCGAEIVNRAKTAKTCLAHAHVRVRPRQRSKNRGDKTYRRVFIGVDGEATTKAGAYGLLATSQGYYIENRQGISTDDLLAFLLKLPKHHTPGGGVPLYVGFAIDYDVNQILADVPLFSDSGPSIQELRATGQIHWRGYTIRYWPRKIFQVARGKRAFTLYDLWGFFQSSFEAALTKWNIPVPAIISEGKKARGSFYRWPLDKIRAYNAAELECLAQLAEKLRASINPLDLKLQSWHGPAALAATWLKKNRVEGFLEEPEPNLKIVAGRAYFGGRIDTRGYGFVEPVYHYDIVSAYPAATRNLPDLSRVRWRVRKSLPETGVYVARIRWDVPESELWPPFPWRKADGTIRFPHKGEGWYWHPELEEARRRFGNCFEVVECYAAEGKISFPLKNLIEETFEYRAQLKAEGNPSHVPVKLILNSIYGKFAQTVGRATFHNLIWAGLITSYTRAELMRAITPGTVLVMTDSLWSAEPLPLDVSARLGAWERGPETRLAVAEAGLYEGFTPDGTRQIYQRGFDKSAPVDISKLVQNWLYDDPTYSPTYTVHRFIGMGLASVTHYEWREWRDIERQIHPVPIVGTTKRLPHYPHELGTMSESFMSLPPRPADNEELSSPYMKATYDPELLERRLEDECFDGDY